MFVLRCTQKLLRRLGSKPNHDNPFPTTALGDWYANPFNVGRLRLIHLLSDRSLLSVLVPLKNIRELVPRHKAALAELLMNLGVESRFIEAELLQMAVWTVGKTRSRSVLGSMRDLAINARWRIEAAQDYTLMTIGLELAETPCGPLDMGSPGEVAPSLLRQRFAQPA